MSGAITNNHGMTEHHGTTEHHDRTGETGELAPLHLEPVPQPAINDMSSDEYEGWKEKQRAKINQLPDGKQKDALLKMLDGHETCAWTKEESALYQFTLKTAEAGAGIVDNDPYI